MADAGAKRVKQRRRTKVNKDKKTFRRSAYDTPVEFEGVLEKFSSSRLVSQKFQKRCVLGLLHFVLLPGSETCSARVSLVFPRFFIISGHYLKYFSVEHSQSKRPEQVRGLIDLHHLKECIALDGALVLHIQNGQEEERLQLRAESEDKARAWKAAFEQGHLFENETIRMDLPASALNISHVPGAAENQASPFGMSKGQAEKHRRLQGRHIDPAAQQDYKQLLQPSDQPEQNRVAGACYTHAFDRKPKTQFKLKVIPYTKTRGGGTRFEVHSLSERCRGHVLEHDLLVAINGQRVEKCTLEEVTAMLKKCKTGAVLQFYATKASVDSDDIANRAALKVQTHVRMKLTQKTFRGHQQLRAEVGAAGGSGGGGQGGATMVGGTQQQLPPYLCHWRLSRHMGTQLQQYYYRYCPQRLSDPRQLEEQLQWLEQSDDHLPQLQRQLLDMYGRELAVDLNAVKLERAVRKFFERYDPPELEDGGFYELVDRARTDFAGLQQDVFDEYGARLQGVPAAALAKAGTAPQQQQQQQQQQSTPSSNSRERKKSSVALDGGNGAFVGIGEVAGEGGLDEQDGSTIAEDASAL
eukprot:g2546.t1